MGYIDLTIKYKDGETRHITNDLNETQLDYLMCYQDKKFGKMAIVDKITIKDKR